MGIRGLSIRNWYENATSAVLQIRLIKSRSAEHNKLIRLKAERSLKEHIFDASSWKANVAIPLIACILMILAAMFYGVYTIFVAICDAVRTFSDGFVSTMHDIISGTIFLLFVAIIIAGLIGVVSVLSVAGVQAIQSRDGRIASVHHSSNSLKAVELSQRRNFPQLLRDS